MKLRHNPVRKPPSGWSVQQAAHYIVYENAAGTVRVLDTRRSGPNHYQVIYQPTAEFLLLQGRLSPRCEQAGAWLELNNFSSLAAAFEAAERVAPRRNPAIPGLTPRQRKMINDLERRWLEGEAMAGVMHDLGDAEAEDAWLALAAEAEAELTAIADELEERDPLELERAPDEESVGEWIEGSEPTPYQRLRDYYNDWVREYANRYYGYNVRDVQYDRWDSAAQWFEAARNAGHLKRKVTNHQLVEAASEAWRESLGVRAPKRLREIEPEAKQVLLRGVWRAAPRGRLEPRLSPQELADLAERAHRGRR